MKKIFKSLFIVMVFTFVLVGCAKTYKLNEDVEISEENIVMTVLSSDEKNINRELFVGNGDYTRVKVRIKNNGTTEYTWNNLSSFTLGDETAAFMVEEDVLPNNVPAGSTVEGYLYFVKNNNKKLTYHTGFKTEKADDENSNVSTTDYVFSIK